MRTEHLRHRIREVLAALPDDQRRAVRFRLFDGWSDAEVASVLGVTPPRAAQLWKTGFTTLWAALRADPDLCFDEGPLETDAPAVAGHLER